MEQTGLPTNWQDQVKTLTAAAMTVIHSPKNEIEKRQLPEAYQKAQQQVQHPEDAGANAIADVSLWVLSQVEQAVEGRGRTIEPIIVMGAIGEICSQVAEVAQTAGIMELSQDDIQIAIATAINKYVIQAKKEGKVTDQQLQEAAQALQKKYPKEAEAFQTMVKQRQQRQSQRQQGVPGQLPQGQQKIQGQQGLLRG